jgi:hypothetical protein
MTMALIKSIYIPRIDINMFNKIPSILEYNISDYIVDKFSKNNIANIDKIIFKPYKLPHIKSKKHKFYSAYLRIQNWHDTENAYNFIKRLKNENKETRFVHNMDDWWTVRINKYDNKLNNPNKKAKIYCHINDNDIHMCILEKQNENNISKINMVNDKLMDIDDFDDYLREKQNKNNISKINMVNDKLMDIDDFDNYLREIHEEMYKI